MDHPNYLISNAKLHSSLVFCLGGIIPDTLSFVTCGAYDNFFSLGQTKSSNSRPFLVSVVLYDSKVENMMLKLFAFAAVLNAFIREYITNM